MVTTVKGANVLNDKRGNLLNQERESSDGHWGLWLLAIVIVLLFITASKGEAQTSLEASSPASLQSGTSSGANLQSGTSSGASLQNGTSLVTSLPGETTKPAFAFSGGLLIDTAMSVKADERAFSGSYVASVGAQHQPSGIGASLKLSYDRNYTYESDDGTDGALADTVVGVKKAFTQVGPFDSVVPGLGLTIPSSREARRRTFRGALGPSLTVTKSLGRFDLMQAVSYRYNLFRYDIQDNGKVNSPHSFRLDTGVSYNLTDKLALSASLAWLHSISFKGVGRSTTVAALSGDYRLSEKIGLSAGVSTMKPTLATDGASNAVTLYDEEEAQAFFDIEIKI